MSILTSVQMMCDVKVVINFTRSPMFLSLYIIRYVSITITSNKLACNKLVADLAPLLVEVYYIYKLKLIYIYFYLLPDNSLVLNM